MKTINVWKTTLIIACAAIVTACGSVSPVHADLTGPKPPHRVATVATPSQSGTGVLR